MDFLKSKMSSGDKGKSSLFGGMKIKGPNAKEQKPPAVQSETSLAFSNKKESPRKSQQQLPQQPQKSTYKERKVSESQPTNDEQQQFRKKQQQQQDIQVQRAKRKASQQPTEKPPTKKPKSQKQQVQPDQFSEKDSDIASERVPNQKHIVQKPREKAKNPMLSQLKKTVPKQEKRAEGQKERSPESKQKKSEKDVMIEEMNKSHLKLIALIQKQKESKQKIIQLSTGLTSLKEDLANNISRQCQAVQKEEYEEADKLQSLIQEIGEKVREMQQEYHKSHSDFHDIQYEELALMKSSWNQNKRLVRKIKLVELQLLEEASALKREQGEKIEEERNKNKHQKKKISRLDADISFQKEQLDQFVRKFTEDKNSRVNPLEEQKKTLITNKTQLEQEIQELERRLKQKRVTLKQTMQALKEINIEIEEIEDSFRGQSSQLEERKSKLQTMESDKLDLQQKLKSMEQHVEESTARMNKKANQLTTEAQSLATVARSIEGKAATIEDLLEQKKAKLDTFIHSSKALQDFQLKHKGAKEKIKELQFAKANILSQVTKCEDRKKQLKNKIPIIQAEQKTMAAAKNFKAAGLKKTEIKEAQEELEELNKKIEANFIQEKQIEGAITEIETEQEQFIDEENQIKKNLAVSQYRFQFQKLSTIKQEREWLENNKKIPNRQKLLELLDSEMESIQQQLDYICQEYNLGKKQSGSNEAQETPKQEAEHDQKKSDEGEVEMDDEKKAQEQIQQQRTEELSPTEEIPTYSKEERDEQNKVGQQQQKQQKQQIQQKQQKQQEQEGGYVPLQLD